MEPELIQYTIFNIAKIGAISTPEQAHEITAALGNAPVEMQGETDAASALLLFFALLDTANEITYRPTGSKTAFVLYSVFLDDEVIRPAGVITPCDWTPSELEALAPAKNKQKTAVLKLDLAALWQETALQQKDLASTEKPATDANMSAKTASNQPQTDAANATHLKAFLEKVYAINPRQEAVTFAGTVPITALCLAALWFRNSTSHISYKKTMIYQKPPIRQGTSAQSKNPAK